MINYFFKKLGFISKKEVEKLKMSFEKEIQNIKNEKQNQKMSKFDFLMKTEIGRPVICLTNANNVISIGIIQGFEANNNGLEPIPIVKSYFNNEDGKEDLQEGLSFAPLVEFSEQRLKALLKLTGEERTALMINTYKYGNEELKLKSLAKYQPNFDEIMDCLTKTSFFVESEKYYL